MFDWNYLKNMDPNEAWVSFKQILTNLESHYIPLRHKRRREKPVWMTREGKRLINLKSKRHKKYIQNRTVHNHDKYIDIRNKTKHCIRETIRSFECKLAIESRTSAKCFWKYVNTKLKRRTGISTIQKPDGSVATSNVEKAETLNDFFASVFVNEDKLDIPDFQRRYRDNLSNDLVFTKNIVFKKLSRLDITKV